MAHPAIVLPLRRAGLVFSALIVGSLTPDLPYFVFASEFHWAHSWLGVFLFCLPVALAALWLFHAVLKRPLVALAPEAMRRRIAPADLEFRFGPARRFAWIVVSLLIGVISHVLWDGFTHDHGYFVKHWALLNGPVETYRVMPMYKALQQGFSALGVAVLAVVTAWWWYRKPIVSEPVGPEMTPRLRWFVITIVVLLACMTGAAAGLKVHFGHQWKMSMIKGVIAAISTTCAELLVFSFVWLWYGKQGNDGQPPDERVQRLEVTRER